MNIEIRIGHPFGRRGVAGVRFVSYLAQALPDRAGVVALLGIEPLEDASDPAVAARYQRLEISLAWRLSVELDAAQAAEVAPQQSDLVANRVPRLHRIPLEWRPRLRHERIERHRHVPDALPPCPHPLDDPPGQLGDRGNVVVVLFGQS